MDRPPASESKAADRYGWLLILLVPTAVIGAGAWLFTAASDDASDIGGALVAPTESAVDESSTGSNPALASGTGSEADAAVSEALTAAAEACGTLWEADSAALAAAAATLEQWRAHVGAQVGFNAGTNTADEAKAQWAASRVGAAENSAAFEEADAAYQAQIAGGDGNEPQRCAVPEGDVSGELAAQVQTCAASLAVHQSALEAARTAYAGWKTHQAEMAALAAGEMARVDELTSWESLWRAGQTNLAVYDERAAQATAAACPLADNQTAG
jgi:hypothetical protein